MTEIVVLVVGGAEKVPITLAAVPPLLRVSVFEPLVTEIAVLAVGVPEAVPRTLAPVPLVFKVRVFEPFTTVIALLAAGGLANVPICEAGVERLAAKLSVPAWSPSGRWRGCR